MSAGRRHPVNLVERPQWGARDPRGEVRLREAPAGVKIHYVGAKVDPRTLVDHSRCITLARSIQVTHMDGNRWADLGYTALVCAHQETFVGRGPGILPAANGKGLNAAHYAVMAMVGNAGVTAAPDLMLHGLCDAIDWLRDCGAGDEVLGHCDGYQTDCPGAELIAWIRAGAPRPSSPPYRPAAGPPWPGRVLEFPPYMRGDDVAVWQAQMKRRGWPIVVDRTYGPDSRDIARKFQLEKGLKGTGTVNRSTWEAAWRAPIT